MSHNESKIKCDIYKNKIDEDCFITSLDWIPDRDWIRKNYGYGSFTLYIYFNGLFRDKLNFDIW